MITTCNNRTCIPLLASCICMACHCCSMHGANSCMCSDVATPTLVLFLLLPLLLGGGAGVGPGPTGCIEISGPPMRSVGRPGHVVVNFHDQSLPEDWDTRIEPLNSKQRPAELVEVCTTNSIVSFQAHEAIDNNTQRCSCLQPAACNSRLNVVWQLC